MQLLNICPTCGEPKITKRPGLVIGRKCACDRAKATKTKPAPAAKAAKPAKRTKAESYATAKRTRSRRGGR